MIWSLCRNNLETVRDTTFGLQTRNITVSCDAQHISNYVGVKRECDGRIELRQQ